MTKASKQQRAAAGGSKIESFFKKSAAPGSQAAAAGPGGQAGVPLQPSNARNQGPHARGDKQSAGQHIEHSKKRANAAAATTTSAVDGAAAASKRARASPAPDEPAHKRAASPICVNLHSPEASVEAGRATPATEAPVPLPPADIPQEQQEVQSGRAHAPPQHGSSSMAIAPDAAQAPGRPDAGSSVQLSSSQATALDHHATAAALVGAAQQAGPGAPAGQALDGEAGALASATTGHPTPAEPLQRSATGGSMSQAGGAGTAAALAAHPQQPQPQSTSGHEGGGSSSGCHRYTLQDLEHGLEDVRAALAQELLLPIRGTAAGSGGRGVAGAGVAGATSGGAPAPNPAALATDEVAAFVEGRTCTLQQLLQELSNFKRTTAAQHGCARPSQYGRPSQATPGQPVATVAASSTPHAPPPLSQQGFTGRVTPGAGAGGGEASQLEGHGATGVLSHLTTCTPMDSDLAPPFPQTQALTQTQEVPQSQQQQQWVGAGWAGDSGGVAGAEEAQCAGEEDAVTTSATTGTLCEVPLRELVMDLATRKSYGNKKGLPEGVLAVDDADPEALWFWELRDVRKALTPPPGCKEAAVVASSNKKMVDLFRKRRKDLRERLEALQGLREELTRSGLSEAHAMQADEGAAPAAAQAGAMLAPGSPAAGGTSSKGICKGKPGGVSKAGLLRLARLAAKLDKLPTVAQIEVALEAGMAQVGEKDSTRLGQLEARRRDREAADAARQVERQAKATQKEEKRGQKEAGKVLKKAGYLSDKELKGSQAAMAAFFKRAAATLTPNPQRGPASTAALGSAGHGTGGSATTPHPRPPFALGGGGPGSPVRAPGSAGGIGLVAPPPGAHSPSSHNRHVALQAAEQARQLAVAAQVEAQRTALDLLLPSQDMLLAGVEAEAHRRVVLEEELRPRWKLEATHTRRPLKGAPPTWARRPGPQPTLHERCVVLWGEGYQPSAVQLFRRKLLRFYDNQRPPYYGSWSRTSALVGPRRPWGRDPLCDYEVDSGSEWEEEPEGTDLEACSDSDASEGRGTGEEEEEQEEGFVVEDGYLSDHEGVKLGDTEDGGEEEGEERDAKKGSRPGVRNEQLVILEVGVARALRSNRPLLLSQLVCPGGGTGKCDPPSGLDPGLLKALAGVVLRPGVMVLPPSDEELAAPQAANGNGSAREDGERGGGEGTAGGEGHDGGSGAGGGAVKGSKPRSVTDEMLPLLVEYLKQHAKTPIDKVVEGFIVSLGGAPRSSGAADGTAPMEGVEDACAGPPQAVPKQRLPSRHAVRQRIKSIASYHKARGWVLLEDHSAAASGPTSSTVLDGQHPKVTSGAAAKASPQKSSVLAHGPQQPTLKQVLGANQASKASKPTTTAWPCPPDAAATATSAPLAIAAAAAAGRAAGSAVDPIVLDGNLSVNPDVDAHELPASVPWPPQASTQQGATGTPHPRSSHDHQGLDEDACERCTPAWHNPPLTQQQQQVVVSGAEGPMSTAALAAPEDTLGHLHPLCTAATSATATAALLPGSAPPMPCPKPADTFPVLGTAAAAAEPATGGAALGPPSGASHCCGALPLAASGLGPQLPGPPRSASQAPASATLRGGAVGGVGGSASVQRPQPQARAGAVAAGGAAAAVGPLGGLLGAPASHHVRATAAPNTTPVTPLRPIPCALDQAGSGQPAVPPPALQLQRGLAGAGAQLQLAAVAAVQQQQQGARLSTPATGGGRAVSSSWAAGGGPLGPSPTAGGGSGGAHSEALTLAAPACTPASGGAFCRQSPVGGGAAAAALVLAGAAEALALRVAGPAATPEGGGGSGGRCLVGGCEGADAVEVEVVLTQGAGGAPVGRLWEAGVQRSGKGPQRYTGALAKLVGEAPHMVGDGNCP